MQLSQSEEPLHFNRTISVHCSNPAKIIYYVGIFLIITRNMKTLNELSYSKPIREEVMHDVLSSSSAVPLLKFPPGIKGTIINIGSSVDPILPRQQDGPCVMTIAFEPIVPNLIEENPRLQVVPAAIAASPGLSTMIYMNRQGVSSSLSEPASSQYWNSNPERDGVLKFVPLPSFLHVLDSIPIDIRINFLKTDMQGHDFFALKASDVPWLRGKSPAS